MSNYNTNSATATASGGIGFTGLLTVLFVGLKLLGVIAWPWIWVLSPLWISFLLALFVIILFLVLAFVFSK